jgi:hypothetical protein
MQMTTQGRMANRNKAHGEWQVASGKWQVAVHALAQHDTTSSSHYFCAGWRRHLDAHQEARQKPLRCTHTKRPAAHHVLLGLLEFTRERGLQALNYLRRQLQNQ